MDNLFYRFNWKNVNIWFSVFFFFLNLFRELMIGLNSDIQDTIAQNDSQSHLQGIHYKYDYENSTFSNHHLLLSPQGVNFDVLSINLSCAIQNLPFHNQWNSNHFLI